MRRKVINVLLVILVLLAIPGTIALASDISGALYSMGITISNNGTLTYNTATTANISSPNLIAGGFMSASANNTAMRDAADNDIPYMPGYSTNPWCMWVPIIGEDSYLGYDLYTAESTGGTVAYFPADGGMTVPDDATLEQGSDFEQTISGFYNTSDSNFTYAYQKRDASAVATTDTSQISGIVYYDEPQELIPTAYNAWIDVDVSDYVPDMATGIVVHLTNAAGAARNVGIRYNGDATALVNSLAYHGWTICGIDANDVFEVYLQDANCHVYIVGFTGEDFTFRTTADDVSLAGAGAWTDIDISAIDPEATGAIIVAFNTGGGVWQWGVRENGSADARVDTIVANGISWAIIGCDGSQIFEGFAQNLAVDFYLLGYTTDNVTFNLNATDKSFGAGFGAWNDIDCSGDTSSETTHIIFEVRDLGGVASIYGFRRNGSVENITLGGNHYWAVVECDENQIVEGWAANANVDWFIIGYIENYVDSPYAVSATATGITSDEYDLTPYGVDNEPQWATGDVLDFDRVVNSHINCGVIYNAATKLWISMWFELDSNFGAGSPNSMYVFSKFLNGANYYQLYLNNATGALRLWNITGGVTHFDIASAETSWAADTWYHVIFSISNVNGARMIVDGGVPITDVDNTPICNGGSFIVGDYQAGLGIGIDGIIQNVIVGTDDLTIGEETDLYAGIAPGDETDYWYIDEGTGTSIYSYGTGANTGTAGAATAWQTSTFTVGQTGRLCDFTIEVDNGVADPDRWGKNLKGISVPNVSTDHKYLLRYAVPYIWSANVTISGVPVSAWEWEYDTTFHDSIGANDATPTFRTTSSDADVIGTAVSFQPIEEAKAPPWTLDTSTATWLAAANITGNFTTTPSPTYPGHTIIESIYDATGTPAQLPFMVIFGFVTLAVSLSISGLMRNYGSRNLFVKAIIIGAAFVIGRLIGIVDLWMVVFIFIIVTAIMAASKPGEVL